MQVQRNSFIPLSTSFPQFPIKKLGGIVIMALGLLAISYCAVRVLKGRIKSAKKLKEVESEKVDLGNIFSIEQHLKIISRQGSLKPSFDQFKLTGGTYIAIGPGKTEHFIQELTRMNSRYHVLVNLLTEDECACLEGFSEFCNPYTWSEKPGYRLGISSHHTFFHFKTWPNRQIPEDVDQMLACANKVAQKEGTLFVHCKMGLQRTSTFITLVELLRNRTFLSPLHNTPTDIRFALYHTLSWVASTAENRVPHRNQLALLFSDDFIAKLKDIATTFPS